MELDERIRAAIAVHVVGKVVMFVRTGHVSKEHDIVQALRMEWSRVRPAYA